MIKDKEKNIYYKTGEREIENSKYNKAIGVFARLSSDGKIKEIKY